MVTLFLLGIVVAILVEEATGFSPGGVVTIPFLAILIGEAHLLVTCLLVSLATFGILRLAERHLAVYGRRRLSLAIMIAALLKTLCISLIPGLSVSSAGFLFLGFLVPGIMADWYRRQGILPTLSSAVVALAVLALVRLGVGQ